MSDLVLRMQPYSKEILEICNQNQDFARALKTTHPDKFISTLSVTISYPQNSKDQVIGYIVYDYSRLPGVFKQDFIVNVGNKNKEYIIYTGKKYASQNRYIRHINEFFNKYPDYSRSVHRPDFEDIPDEIKQSASRAKSLGDIMRDKIFSDLITEQKYKRIDAELKKNGR